MEKAWVLLLLNVFPGFKIIIMTKIKEMYWHLFATHLLRLPISLNKYLLVGHCANHENTMTSGEFLLSSREEELGK